MLDTFSDDDQHEMAAFIYADSARCPAGHPLMLSMRPEPFLVDSEVCEWCKGQETVRDRDEKGKPEQARRGVMYSVRPKL